MRHTAVDLDSLNPGYAGLLGMGRVDAGAAVTTPAQPLLNYQGHTVNGIPNGRPEPGDTAALDVTIYNDWADAAEVQAALSTTDPYVTLVEPAAAFGDVPSYGTGINAASLVFDISGSAPYAHVLNLTLTLTANGDYSTSFPITIQLASAVVEVPATITTQTWTNDRIYVINKVTGIPEGHTLTIEPGTEIRFDSGLSLQVSGTLIADGTGAQPIIFTSNQPNPASGDWGQIIFRYTSRPAEFNAQGDYQAGSILRHTIVEYGSGVFLNGSSPYIAFNTIENFSEAALSGSKGSGQLKINGNIISEGNAGMQIFGSGEISENTISSMVGRGIYAMGPVTVTANRITNNGGPGLFIDGGVISRNLLAANDIGIQVSGGEPVIANNTVLYNKQTGIQVDYGTPTIQNNNLIAADGAYAVRLQQSSDIDAAQNWWGSADEAAIQNALWDGMDEFGLGMVDYSGYLVAPEQTAPAYVVDVDIAPDTTLGIQTAAFDVVFSRPMNPVRPHLYFNQAQRKPGTWSYFNTGNSGLPDNQVITIAPAPEGSVWISTRGGVVHFDGEKWTDYTSNLPPELVVSIAAESDKSVWFGLGGYGGVVHFDGVDWIHYTTENSGLPNNNVRTIHVDTDGSIWFGTSNGIIHFDKSIWTIYNTDNSILTSNTVVDIETDVNGTYWFAMIPDDIYGTTAGGIAQFDGSNWTTFTKNNSALPNEWVMDIAPAPDGTLWLGTNDGAVHFDGNSWLVYKMSDVSLSSDNVKKVVVDSDGAAWFATDEGAVYYDGSHWKVYLSTGIGNSLTTISADRDGSHWFGTFITGLAVFWNTPTHTIQDNPQWLDDHTYRATFDITSLIKRGEYELKVSGAVGTDGFEIHPADGYPFTVDYAGAVGDTTPPSAPVVTACAGETQDTLTANWSASDPDSEINLYSYAIGTAPGGADIVGWTNTTATAFDRTGLTLLPNQPYYISVKARNLGGLWSPASTPDPIYPGSGTCTTTTAFIYLPILNR